MKDKKSVFISYSSKDMDIVNKVVEMLKENGISYWKAPEMIPAGSNYAKEIPRVICECDVFLLIISVYSQDSIWVEKEIDFAINNKKIIVPLNLTDGKLTDMFSFYLNNVQMVNYTGNKKHALEVLRQRIECLLPENNNEQEVTAVTGNNTEKVKTAKEEAKYDNYGVVIENKKNTDADVLINDENRNAGNFERQNAEVIKENVREAEKNNKKYLRQNAFDYNPQPKFCKECNGKLQAISKGVYKCMKCGAENYDYYQTIKNFLEKSGPCSTVVIEKATNIPRKSIDYFVKNEMLEIPRYSTIKLRCQKCGTSIRSGYLCEWCKNTR